MKLALLLLLALVGLARAADRATLQLNWKPEPQFGGFYEAQRAGLYAAAGLDVTVEQGKAGTPGVALAANRTVDFAVVSGDELVIARGRGLDLVAVFAVYQTNPQALMTRADRNLADLGALFRAPGTVALQGGLPYALFLKQKFGFDQVRIVPSPFGDLTFYRRDPAYALQCFATSEPLAAEAAGLPAAKVFLVADAGFNPYTTVVVTHGANARERPAFVRAFAAATREGWTRYLTNPAPTNELMRALNPTLDAATFARSAEAQKPLIESVAGVGEMTAERWQTLADQLLELKLIDKPVKAQDVFVDVLE